MLVCGGLNLMDEVKIALAKEILRLFQNVVYNFCQNQTLQGLINYIEKYNNIYTINLYYYDHHKISFHVICIWYFSFFFYLFFTLCTYFFLTSSLTFIYLFICFYYLFSEPFIIYGNIYLISHAYLCLNTQISFRDMV
jgi:hypothetical protein